MKFSISVKILKTSGGQKMTNNKKNKKKIISALAVVAAINSSCGTEEANEKVKVSKSVQKIVKAAAVAREPACRRD